MISSKLIFLTAIGVIAGGLIAIQSILNASLGQKAGNLGAVLVLTIISAITLAVLVFLFPTASNLKDLPGISEWYLYAGGILGVVILAAPIFLLPRLGTTSTLVAIILGQSLFAVIIDHFGLLASPKIEISFVRITGLLLVAIGAYLVGK
jgi:transporter family-2 protein